MAESEHLAHSVAGACKRINIGHSKFYELVKSGQIRVFKIGNKTLVAEAELKRLVDELSQAAAA